MTFFSGGAYHALKRCFLGVFSPVDWKPLGKLTNSLGSMTSGSKDDSVLIFHSGWLDVTTCSSSFLLGLGVEWSGWDTMKIYQCIAQEDGLKGKRYGNNDRGRISAFFVVFAWGTGTFSMILKHSFMRFLVLNLLLAPCHWLLPGLGSSQQDSFVSEVLQPIRCSSTFLRSKAFQRWLCCNRNKSRYTIKAWYAMPALRSYS